MRCGRRQDLESWIAVLEQAQAEVDAARERVERARVGGEELVPMLAGDRAGEYAGFRAVRWWGGCCWGIGWPWCGHGERPPVWRSGMGEEVLRGLYREVFAAVAALGPVNGRIKAAMSSSCSGSGLSPRPERPSWVWGDDVALGPHPTSG